MFRYVHAACVLAAVALLCLAPSPLRARPSDADVAAFFDRHVAAALADGEVPGGALIVVRDGRVILSRGYGVADLDSGEQLSPEHHLLRQASISKLAIWLMAMQLVDEGRLDLDRDVNAYLPFRIEPQFGLPITMRHLLTHSAGFSERYMGVFGRPTAGLCDTVRDHLPRRVSPPGERVSYSNSGAALAACIVERATGKPFDVAARERIFEPLGMRTATFAQPPEGARGSRLASTYGASARTATRFEFIAIPPAGAMSASAEDMGRLLVALTEDGSEGAGRLVGSGTLANMLRLHRPLAPGLPAGFGLGFVVREHRGTAYVGHPGTTAAVVTDMEMIPELGIGWYLGMTGMGRNGIALDIRAELPAAVIDRFAPGAAPRAFGRSTARDAEGHWLPARRFRAGPLKLSDLNLVGVRADAQGNLRIDSVVDLAGEPRVWIPQGEDRFAEAVTGTPLVLVRDPDGQVVRFASAMVNPVSDLERAPAWMAFALPLFGASTGAILVAGLAIPVAAASRRLWGRRPPERQDRFVRASRIGVAFMLATLIGWFVLIAVVSDDPYKLGTSGPALTGLGAMAMLTPVAALAVLAHAAVLVRSGRYAAGGLRAAVGTAAATSGVLLYAFGLASVSTDF
ncbi:MAG: serine hydrolase domain-containing protein [Allosphingosinicella sp.]|uniref:serine hydrolase domain-containing protein n=1 Tax=Allosphingosinicella sp. TaxID=2823234 RepID=UPI00394B473D